MKRQRGSHNRPKEKVNAVSLSFRVSTSIELRSMSENLLNYFVTILSGYNSLTDIKETPRVLQTVVLIIEPSDISELLSVTAGPTVLTDGSLVMA